MGMVASTSERTKIRSELVVRVYRSKNDRKWYWNLTNKGNREIEGASSEGYNEQRDCMTNLWRVTGFEPDIIIDAGDAA